MKIIASGRCFFPWGAFLWSTRKQAEIAKKAGYEGMEFLPTWRVVSEVFRYNRLLSPEKMVTSFHRDWRFDRVMEARVKSKPSWFYQLKNREDWLFPPSPVNLKILKKLQKRYRKPVSVTWFDDTPNFSPVMLELWGRAQGINFESLKKWLIDDPENRGVVLDTGKLTSWFESNNLLKKKKQVVKKLLPHVFEVHYRFKKGGRDMAMGGR